MFHRIAERFRKKELEQTGVYVGAISEQTNRHRALICFLRGLVIFMGTYGTIIGILDAFKLPYNSVIVTLAFFLISMYVAFLYLNKVFFYAGYFLLLGGFTIELVHWYMYANSGYQAITNEIYSAYSDYFKLLSVREGQEFVEQRYITVTVAAIFLGVFLAMMLNVTISGYMNVVETALVTLPLLEVAFFINYKPPIYCLCMVLAMYVFVGVLQASRFQRMQVKGKHTPEFLRFKRKNKKIYGYQGDAKGNLFTLIAALIISLIVCIIAFPFYNRDNEYVSRNPVRKKTEDYVKIFVQNGFYGFLSRYDSTGGMNSGRLGGVGEVRPDFETDLNVTFTPYTFNTVYLKGFTGSYYAQNQWFPIAYLEGANPAEYPQYAGKAGSNNILNETQIKEYDSEYLPEARATARMNIINLDADPTNSYLPYFTDATKYHNFSIVKDSTKDFANGVDITYNPLLENYYVVPESHKEINDEKYEYYVNESCTYLRDEQKTELQEYIKEHNFFDADIDGFTEEENVSKFRDVNDYRLSMARKVYSHYVSEFDYTMAPGTTPYGRDYVTYFLTKQKRGYCAHFASSGVMLLRAMDIPARYVEGYCIPPSLLAESGVALDENTDEWYEGDTLLDETGVVNVDVNDSYAHAWIEIYMEGYGFVPFEMTPPDEDESDNTSAFNDLFSGLFRFRFNIAELPDNSSSNNSNQDRMSKLLSFRLDFGKFLLPLGIAIGTLLLILTGYITVRKVRESRRLKRLYREGKYSELVYIKYSAFVRFLLSDESTKTASPNPLPDEVSAQTGRLLAGKNDEYTDESIRKFFDYIEKTLYSPHAGSKEEYDYFAQTILQMQKSIRKMK